MDKSQSGRVSLEAARIYDEFYLPALFAQWPVHLFEAAELGRNYSVLDIACGTGVLACQADALVGDRGRVTAIDINPDMLAVAREKAGNVNWILGNAEELPFPDSAFDAAFNQFGLMFFPDRKAALREMYRVVRPGGNLVLAVWDELENSPGYDAMVRLLDKLFGSDVANSLTFPFCLGDLQVLKNVLDEADVGTWSVRTLPGDAKFPSLRDWVFTDVKGWTADDQIDDAGFVKLLDAAGQDLQSFVQGDGTVRFDAPVHICTLTR